jgi:Icc protein
MRCRFTLFSLSARTAADFRNPRCRARLSSLQVVGTGLLRSLRMSSVRLTHFTDPHLYGSESGELRGVATLPALRAALAHAQRRGWPPDAVLVTGDLVQDDASGYTHFRRVFESLGPPVLCLPGNHDEPQAMRRELGRAPFRLDGAVDLGLWRIVLLDSCVPGAAEGRLSGATLAALESALAAAPSRHALVCLHHHPVAMSSRWLDRVGLANAEEFLETLDRHANVRGVIWGHVHQSHDSLRNGVRLLASPSTCAQFLPRSEHFALDRRPPGYRTLELKADGSILTEVVWLSDGSARSALAGSAAA